MIKATAATFEKNSSGIPAVAERGADAERRALILDKGEQVFLEQGFQGASMAAIAQRSGCSKGTLYNYFVSKEELFLACVARQCAGFQETMSTLSAGGGAPVPTLTQIGTRYVEFVSSDDIVRRFRMIVGEAERSPEMARAFYSTGPARGAQTLSVYIEGAMRDGVLKPGDPLRAAHHFLGLCYDRHSKARLCAFEEAPDAATIEQDVAEAVRVFMAAYG
jgi:AcrR family transcriptional regulator